MADGLRGIPRLLRAARVTYAGLRAAAVNEEAFRIELAGCLVLVPLGIWLGDNGIERALLVGSLLFVLVVELINSGVEAMYDIRKEAENDIAKVKGAPWNLPVRRLDDVRAARQLDLKWQEAAPE